MAPPTAASGIIHLTATWTAPPVHGKVSVRRQPVMLHGKNESVQAATVQSSFSGTRWGWDFVGYTSRDGEVRQGEVENLRNNFRVLFQRLHIVDVCQAGWTERRRRQLRSVVSATFREAGPHDGCTGSTIECPSCVGCTEELQWFRIPPRCLVRFEL